MLAGRHPHLIHRLIRSSGHCSGHCFLQFRFAWAAMFKQRKTFWIFIAWHSKLCNSFETTQSHISTRNINGPREPIHRAQLFRNHSPESAREFSIFYTQRNTKELYMELSLSGRIWIWQKHQSEHIFIVSLREFREEDTNHLFQPHPFRNHPKILYIEAFPYITSIRNGPNPNHFAIPVVERYRTS